MLAMGKYFRVYVLCKEDNIREILHTSLTRLSTPTIKVDILNKLLELLQPWLTLKVLQGNTTFICVGDVDEEWLSLAKEFEVMIHLFDNVVNAVNYIDKQINSAVVK